MKNIFILLSTFVLCSFVKKEIAMVPQVNTILYADVIFLGKIIKVDSLGFYVAVQEEVVNSTSNKNLLKTKELFVTYKLNNNNGTHNYSLTPAKDAQYIFTLKYDEKLKKIQPFYYNFGIDIFKNQDNKCYVVGNQKQELLEVKKVIEGITKLKKIVLSQQNLWQEKVIQFSVTDKDLTTLKNSNQALKIWIEEIETRNNYYKSIKK